MERGSSPHTVTSRRRITYRRSVWRAHQFEIWAGELVCRVAVLRLEGSLLLWAGGTGVLHLTEVALGLPPPGVDSDRTGLATALVGGEGDATVMARRLAASLEQPVYVCLGTTFDRFTVPLVERGLISELKKLFS